MKSIERESHKNFFLVECGDCSGWAFDVLCNRTNKLGKIQITKCNKSEVDYTVIATNLDEGCNIDQRDYPKEREALIGFLMANFSRVGDDDPCYEFFMERDICPDCGDPLLQSENDA